MHRFPSWTSGYLLDCVIKYVKLILIFLGILGKRTKYQQRAVSQLAPDVVIGKNEKRLPANETHPDTILPTLKELNDDLRLESIQYVNIEDSNPSELTSIEQIICLNTL
jgi:hypothetical protein